MYMRSDRLRRTSKSDLALAQQQVNNPAPFYMLAWLPTMREHIAIGASRLLQGIPQHWEKLKRRFLVGVSRQLRNILCLPIPMVACRSETAPENVP